MRRWNVLRFINMVTPVRTVLLLPMGATLVFGAWLEAKNPGSSDSAVAFLMLLQLFAVSTGFVSHARRGFYDPVLERVPRRAIAHFFCALWPGCIVLVGIGIAELIAGGRTHALGASAWTALALISSVAWAVSVRAGALSGGAVWLLASLALLLSGRGLNVLGVIKAAELGQASLRDVVETGLLYPVTIPSLNLSTPAEAILLGVSATALTAGVEYIARADFPIREEQG
ncbi:MAG: hypothetical protein ABI682_11075 [Acidobacteriota bacterium]